jgi:hypothetical protein
MQRAIVHLPLVRMVAAGANVGQRPGRVVIVAFSFPASAGVAHRRGASISGEKEKGRQFLAVGLRHPVPSRR